MKLNKICAASAVLALAVALTACGGFHCCFQHCLFCGRFLRCCIFRGSIF